MTYLILNEEKLDDENEIDILGYFALSTKVLHLPEEITKSQRKKIDGLYNSVSEISTYLIGQIGKNDANKDLISGEELVEYATKFIEEASSIVGGRIILVELKNNEKLIKFYNENGFIELPNTTKNEDELLQMIRII